MNLTGLRNIHVPAPSSVLTISRSDPPVESPPPDFTPRHQKVSRAPAEELQARIAAIGAPEAIPDALAAIILSKQRRETVAANGISFIEAGTTYRYWHENSATCRKVGEKVLLLYDPDERDVIYIISESGEYVETVPRADKVEWFSADMDKQIERHRRVAKRVHEGLKKTHALTAKREHDRTKANAEALQFAHEFRPDQPAPAEDRPAAPCAPAAAMPRALALSDRIEGVRRFKADFEDRREQAAARIAATRGSIEDVYQRDAEGDAMQEMHDFDEAEADVEALAKIYGK
ncbi:MAG: Mu transposase C-terminal domain-containing protein [Kiritimatiellae bacterium]|nr:Mu transposase C-terminal domain-containing protein [Kiritimatiellia bacterium]